MKNQELIEVALYDNLPYRYNLEIPRVFGLEIEMGLFNEMDRKYIMEGLKEKGYTYEVDVGLKTDFPYEIQTPKLYGTKEVWNQLFLLSERMKKCQINFDYAAFQINMDVHYKTINDFFKFCLFFMKFEHILFKFSTSNHEFLRPLTYANSLKKYFKIWECRKVEEFNINRFRNNKEYCIALKNSLKNNTFIPDIIEYRIPNGCDDAWLWQNYINTFYHLQEKIPFLDLEYFDYRSYLTNKPYVILYLEDACLLANLIFEKDIDKIYFLRQYIDYDREELKRQLKNKHS